MGTLLRIYEQPKEHEDNRLTIFKHFKQAIESGEMYKSGFHPGDSVIITSQIHNLVGKTPLRVHFVCRNYLLLIDKDKMYGVTVKDVTKAWSILKDVINGKGRTILSNGKPKKGTLSGATS
jgi:hypothetical protein